MRNWDTGHITRAQHTEVVRIADGARQSGHLREIAEAAEGLAPWFKRNALAVYYGYGNSVEGLEKALRMLRAWKGG